MGDNGEVLQGLNERWTFIGANLMEWMSGFSVFAILSVFSQNSARAMPFMLLGWIATTLTIASLRKSFPDEERGVRNSLSVSCGFSPMGIPDPASLQPVWSAGKIKEIKATSKYAQLGLGELFPSHIDQLVDEFDGFLGER